jgi:hypothetical protein
MYKNNIYKLIINIIMVQLMVFKNKILLASVSIIFISLYNYRKRIYDNFKYIKRYTIWMGTKLLDKYIFNNSKKKEIISEVIKLTQDEMFIDKYKNIFKNNLEPFLKSLEVINNCELNKNIQEFYYNKIEFNNRVIYNDELIWKRRNIIINTPYGNVGMYYNLFHKGFSYYCDNKNIPNNILNCVSMYYVLKFNCLNFYVDNTIIVDWISPYWDIWFNEKNNETEKNNPFNERLTDKKQILLPTDKKCIVKYKNYKLNDLNKNNIIYIKNIYIYGGKLNDMLSLLSNKKKKYIKPKEISYSEYCNLLNTKSIDIENNNNYSNLFI